MLLYRKSDMQLLASKVFTLPTAGDNDVSFDTPVAVAANTRYVSAVLANRYAFTVGGWPFTAATMTAPSGVNGRLATTVADTPVYPSTIHASAANFFIGPLVNFGFTASLGGSVTPAGSPAKAATRTLAAAVTPAAGLSRQTLRSLAATLTPAAVAAKSILKRLVGSLVPASAILKLLSRLLGGSVSPAGVAVNDRYVQHGPVTSNTSTRSATVATSTRPPRSETGGG